MRDTRTANILSQTMVFYDSMISKTERQHSVCYKKHPCLPRRAVNNVDNDTGQLVQKSHRNSYSILISFACFHYNVKAPNFDTFLLLQ